MIAFSNFLCFYQFKIQARYLSSIIHITFEQFIIIWVPGTSLTLNLQSAKQHKNLEFQRIHKVKKIKNSKKFIKNISTPPPPKKKSIWFQMVFEHFICGQKFCYLLCFGRFLIKFEHCVTPRQLTISETSNVGVYFLQLSLESYRVSYIHQT